MQEIFRLLKATRNSLQASYLSVEGLFLGGDRRGRVRQALNTRRLQYSIARRWVSCTLSVFECDNWTPQGWAAVNDYRTERREITELNLIERGAR